MYTFNDRLYFWVLKPVAQGYSVVVPEPARVSVSNFFSNLRAPIRLVNCVLQANPIGAATELFRFMINSTVGLAGLFDPAGGEEINLQRDRTRILVRPWESGDWDRASTSSGRSRGLPACGIRQESSVIISCIPSPTSIPGTSGVGVRGYEVENEVSLRIGDYEAIKEAAIDPYIAFRDAYVQYRLNKVEGQPAPFRQWY